MTPLPGPAHARSHVSLFANVRFFSPRLRAENLSKSHFKKSPPLKKWPVGGGEDADVFLRFRKPFLQTTFA
jgi:hypothetical protein